MIKRIIFGSIYALIIGLTILVCPVLYPVLLFIFFIQCTREFFNLYKKPVPLYFYIIVSIIPFLTLIDVYCHTNLKVTALGITLLITFSCTSLQWIKDEAQLLTHTIVYLSIPFGMAIILPYLSSKYQFNTTLIVPIFLAIWVNDSFAYITGKYLGKTPLSSLSPKKTIEGLLGGIISVLILFYFLYHFEYIPNLSHSLLLGIGLAIFGNLGDLYESKLKRTANVKDTGNWIPGHGGLLDRLDSFIFAVIYATIFYIIIL